MASPLLRKPSTYKPQLITTLENMAIKNLFIVIIVALSIATLAKRLPPAEVPDVIHDGVIYTVPHFGFEIESNQNGGFVKAIDATTKETMWVKRIYKNWYSPFGNVDAQDVFITTMQLSSDKQYLQISNERNRHFELNLKTRKVKKLKQL